MYHKVCLNCGKEFDTKRAIQKFHSQQCHKEYKQKRYFARNPKKLTLNHLNHSTVGAIHELLVAADLMKRGYDVYRALSPASPCDLAILKDRKLLRVEVKTTYKTRSDSLWWNGEYKADILALVTHAGDIEYRPHLGPAELPNVSHQEQIIQSDEEE